MRLGLYITSPAAEQEALAAVLSAQDIPLAGFTDAASLLFSGSEDRTAFLLRLGEAVFRGDAIPGELILRNLQGDAQPGNVLRRYLEWQQSLAPYLCTVDEPCPGNGFIRLGKNLLLCPLSEEGAADALLPPGLWTELATGETMQGRFRRMRGPNGLPLLAAEGALIPTGDPTCPTLHWYQPPPDSLGLMHREPYHLILHQNGVETFLR